MRLKIINYLKIHPFFTRLIWLLMEAFLIVIGVFVPRKPKTILFSSFGGRRFDDSPRAIYEEICQRPFFDDWRLIWAFTDPDAVQIPRGEKVKIDTFPFFIRLLQSQVWVSNTGITRGINLNRKHVLRVETWHGTPLKKICGDENQNTIGGKRQFKGPLDASTIRCAQSEYDRKLFARLFHAEDKLILLSDLPRNDALLRYTD